MLCLQFVFSIITHLVILGLVINFSKPDNPWAALRDTSICLIGTVHLLHRGKAILSRKG
ncbi:MAG: hypothetical protein JWM16_2396 [Verrucomicrobiales bacterium]|nr:hypothetical protein [Verrucomicrobiales bacterium]